MIVRDMTELSEYIEFDVRNLACFSNRIFKLYMTICMEIESVFKHIYIYNHKLRRTEFTGKKAKLFDKETLNIIDYSQVKKIYASDDNLIIDLPSISINLEKLDRTGSEHGLMHPYTSFECADKKDKSPRWYKAYNDVKHSRYKNFHEAKLEHLFTSYCALYIILHFSKIPFGDIKAEHGRFICSTQFFGSFVSDISGIRVFL